MKHTAANEKPEIVIMRRTTRYANRRFKPAYYRVYQNCELKGEFATRPAALRLAEKLMPLIP